MPESTDATRAPSEEELRNTYFRLLMAMVEGHGTATAAAQAGLQRVANDPSARIGQDLIDIIKVLCDCKAIIEILDCLCRLFTGGRVAGTASQA